MLDIAVNGEALMNAQYNDSKTKQHHAFPKAKRFSYREASFVTEFNLDLSTENFKKRTHNTLKDHSFGARKTMASSADKPPGPDFGTYDPKLLRHCPSVPFPIGRSVTLPDVSVSELLPNLRYKP